MVRILPAVKLTVLEYVDWVGIVILLLQGAYFAWKATAMGKNYINGKTFLEKR